MAEKTITMIPARKRVGSQDKTQEEKPKLRVAAYCRVSTDSEEQESSYEMQVAHYTEYIEGHKDWVLAGIYADDGISGTNTKKREEFNRMITDCMDAKIDMVITKSISRFARNTLDCLKYIRQLKEKNISVFFEKENINTMDAKGEVLITIMASLAQQESQSLSQNVKLGLQFRYQAGKVQVNHNRFLGYTKDADGNLVIEPKEAEVVKRIYREYLDGASLKQIGMGLERDGIRTAAGGKQWRGSTLTKILKNEKYIGDALLQKTYTVDFLTKKGVNNNGIVPQYYVENSHPAIIPRDKYMRVQAEMHRRAHLRGGSDNRKQNYSGKYALTGVVCCAHCDNNFRRIKWNNNGCKSTVWRCVSMVSKEYESCAARTVNEEWLHDIVIRAVNKLLDSGGDFLPKLKENIEKGLHSEEQEEVGRIDAKLLLLQEELIRKANARQDYEGTAEEIERLRAEKDRLLLIAAGKENDRQRLIEIAEFLERTQGKITDYDDILVRRLIEKITVFDHYFLVEFKTGAEFKIIG